MQASFYRAVFVAILVTAVTGVNAQSTLALKSATFTIPFKMKYYSTDGTNHPADTVWIYEHEHFYKDNYYHDDTLFTLDIKKYGIDSFAYFWSTVPIPKLIPRTMEMHFKIDTQSRRFINFQYYYNYSYKKDLPPNPYTVHTEDYTNFGIDLSSLPYFVQDTILSIDLKGEEFFFRVKSAGLSDGYKESWQEKYYHENERKWISQGIDSNTVMPSCHLKFIVPKNFQSSVLPEKSESTIYFNVSVIPISGDIMLMFSPATDNSTLYLYDILGRLVHSITIDNGKQDLTLPSSLFKTGVYFANLSGKLVKFSITK